MEITFYPNLLLKSPIDGGATIDTFEIHPCVEIEHMGGIAYDQCEENDPDIAIWGVYVHFIGGGLENIADCKTKDEAGRLVASLEKLIANYKPS